MTSKFFLNSQRDDFIASINTYASLYCISTTGYHIILKVCIRLNKIKKQDRC